MKVWATISSGNKSGIIDALLIPPPIQPLEACGSFAHAKKKTKVTSNI